MQETNKNQKLEDFAKSLSKKYSLNENILLDILNNNPKDFWNNLFQIIIEKAKLNNSSNSLDKENIDNIKTIQNFNKENIDKEIENYFSKNPEENKDIFDEYKKGNINIEKNYKIKLDVLSPTSSSTDKKVEPNNNIKLKRMPSPDKRKKSVFINKNKKFNFSIGINKNRRHQSIIEEIHNLNKIDSNKSFKNDNLKLSKKNSKSINKKSKFSNANKKYKNRKSCFVKIENNCNLEYNNSKKNIIPIKNRKSVFIPQNNFGFKFNTNNISKDKKIIGNSKGNKIKSLFNKKQSQAINEEKDDNKDNEIIISPEDNNSNSINKNEAINNDNEFIKKENKNINEKININEIEKNNYFKGKDEINFTTEINKEKTKIKEETINIKIYKNKNTFSKIYKSKKLKSLSKPKKYLSNLICHQISITLKAIFNKVPNNNIQSLKKINNSNNKEDKEQKKFGKVIKNTLNKEIRKRDKKEIKCENYKNNNIENTNDDEEEKEENAYINNNRNINSFDSKKNKKSKITEKNNKSLIKIYNGSIYRIPNNNNFEENTYNSEKFNNYLNTTNNLNKDNTINNSQMTLNTTRPENKYYKMSKNNIINCKYNNQNNRYDINRLVKEIEVKKRSQGKEYKPKNNNKNELKNNNKINSKNISKTNNNNKKNISKKKNYLERYKEAIANIMKNDESIYNDDSELFYIKEDNKKNENLSELKLNENKKEKSKKCSTIKIKKNLYSSYDNILKNKYKD